MAKRALVGEAARIPNPSLANLAWLIGTWQATGEHPLLPDMALRGTTVFEWHEGGAFIAMRSEVDHKDIPGGIALIGSDDGEERLRMLYFDERGTSRHMEVIAGDGFIVWRRDLPSFRQIWTLTRTSEGKLTGRGRMAKDGGEWEDDLALDYELMAE